MDEDGPTKHTSPLINTSNWTATSTYDVYMVDTLKSPPRRWHKRRRGHNGEPNGNNATTNENKAITCNVNDTGGDTQSSPVRNGSPEKNPEDLDLNDLFEGADDNYMPESGEDESLGTEDYIVPKVPLEQGRIRRHLVITSRSMKRKQQLLQANMDALNKKWLEVLSVEQDLKHRRCSAPKSYPCRRLLS